MKTQVITEKVIKAFATCLKNEEKRKNTIEKYLRDVRKFSEYMNGLNISKEDVIAYKDKLFAENFAVRSINSMIASVNCLLCFLGLPDFKVKSIKLQRQIYCPEEKELTRKNTYAL